MKDTTHIEKTVGRVSAALAALAIALLTIPATLLHFGALSPEPPEVQGFEPGPRSEAVSVHACRKGINEDDPEGTYCTQDGKTATRLEGEQLDAVLKHMGTSDVVITQTVDGDTWIQKLP